MKQFTVTLDYDDIMDDLVVEILVYWIGNLNEEIRGLWAEPSLQVYQIKDLRDAIKFRNAIITTLQYCTAPDRFSELMEDLSLNEEDWQ